MRRRFFVEGFANGRATLQGEAAHHLGHVLRAEPGQLYELSDGHAVWLARVERAAADSVEFSVVEPIAAREPRLRATLLLAVVKFDRFEWALEKATELGVEVVMPLAAERSQRPLLAAAPKRAARWEKILRESAQQARCLKPPALQPLLRPAEAFRAQQDSIKLMLSERLSALPLRDVLVQKTQDGSAVAGDRITLALAVGPEGGWTEGEFAAASAAGFREAAIGENILRAETAVVAGLAAGHLYFDR